MKIKTGSFFKVLYIEIAVIIIAFSTISCQASNKELIVGTWQLVSIDTLDKTNTDEKMRNEVEHYIKYFDFALINFGTDNVFFNETEIKEQKRADNVEYRLINEEDFSNYPNFEKNNDGNWIAFVMIQKDGSLYNGKNIYEPCEIVSLSDNEMTLIIRSKFRKMESTLGKFVVKYKRIAETGE